jgi:hypothetical protein
MGKPAEQTEPISIGELYPHLSGEELEVAEANFRRYVAVIVRIYDRLKREGRSWPSPGRSSDLTASGKHPIIPNERSNSP